jgi:hypothetical protein
MSSDQSQLSPHPAPKRQAIGLHETLFALFGGPIAWFIQMNAGFALASQPCFQDGLRLVEPTAASDRSWGMMIALIVIAFAVAIASAALSWRVYARTEDEAKGDHRHLMEVGAGRTRFLALWGILLGAGSAVATLLTAAGVFVLPRCAG